MRALALAAALLVLATVNVATQKAKPERATVFVTSVGARDGFTDPSKDNIDTVKDLKNAIRDRDHLELVERLEDATITLTVIGREIGGAQDRDRTIVVRFRCCESFETEMRASVQGGIAGSAGAWRMSAGKLSKQIDEWAVANRAKLKD